MVNHAVLRTNQAVAGRHEGFFNAIGSAKERIALSAERLDVGAEIKLAHV